jgi:hypothetical protein
MFLIPVNYLRADYSRPSQYEAVPAAVTKYYKPHGLYHRNSFSHSPRGWKFKSRLHRAGSN